MIIAEKDRFQQKKLCLLAVAQPFFDETVLRSKNMNKDRRTL